MSRYCGHCAHWGKPDEAGLEFRSCLGVVHDEDGLVDGKPLDKSRSFRQEHKAVVQDGSGYYAALKTRNDFGCELWVKKF